MASRPAPAAVLEAMLAAILAAMLVPATAQRCKATFRPVTVDMALEEGDGYGEGDSGMARLSVNYVEFETTDGSPIYVKPRGCPAGTREPNRILEFRQQGCTPSADPAHSPPCQEDEDAFWADPFTYVCVDHGWNHVYCDIHDPTEHGGGDEVSQMCCPDDKPNYIKLVDHETWNPRGGYCTATTLPAEMSGQGVGEELLSGDYEFSDKVPASGQVELELMTIKDLYDTYDSKAATMMESMVGIHSYGCEGEIRQSVPMPPFAKDVASTYFTFVHYDPIPGNNEIRSIRKLTPFDSAMSKKHTDGTCRMVVSLKDVPEVEGELVSIDGVDFSCLVSAYSRVPDAYVVLDAYTALARTTGQVPAANDNVTVTLKASDGTLTEYSVTSKYEYYNSLKTKLDKRNDDRWMRDFECGGMDFNRMGGRVNPGNLNPTCPRDGVTVEVNDPRAEAMANMSSSKLGFAIFGKMFNIATGREVEHMSNPNPPNFDPEKGRACLVGMHPRNDMMSSGEAGGLFNADGDPICMNGSDEIIPTRAPGHCSFERFGELTVQMNKLIDAAIAGTSSATWTDFMQYTGTDDWIECMDIFMSSMTDAVGDKQIETDMCSKELPEDVYNPWGFCMNATNADHAYCADPCCNFELQSKKCCAPTMQTVSVPRPEIDWENFAYRCLASDYSARGGCGVECFDKKNTIGSALAPATNIFKTQKAPHICLEASSAVTTKALAIQKDLSCCLKAVIGEFNWNSNSFKSNQPCNNPSECYSGKCIKTKEDSNPEKNMEDSQRCFPEGKSFTNACAVASQEKAGEALATCVVDKLTSRGGFDRQIASLKIMLGGSSSATLAEVGDGIISLGAHETCEGPDGWRFDPNNWCQNYNYTTGKCGENNCDTVEECKTACLAATACNWRSWTYNPVTNEHRQTTSAECTDASLSTGFCEAKNEWGGVDDLTEQGFCRPSTPMILGDYGWWTHEHANITDTECTAVDTGLVATTSPWSSMGEKHCTWSAGNSDKGTCFAKCSGTNGFKPPKLYQCYKDTNVATGKCEETGWFTRRREDWDVDLPWDVKRPTFCVTETWGPNGVDAQNGWELDLTGVSGNGLNNNPLSKNWNTKTDSDWVPNVLGRGSHWDGLTFIDETIANAVCTQLGASVRVSDDGTDNCGQDACWLSGVTDETTCNALDASGVADHGWFDWRSGYDGGSGACFAHPTHNYPTYDEYDPWSSGSAATVKRKALCTSIGIATGQTTTFYVGRQFHAGKLDTQIKCEGSTGNVQYCNVAGPRYELDSSTCASIGGKCQNTNGCLGCRAPWHGEVVDSNGTVVDKEGICYKGGATSQNDCKSGHSFIASLGMCIDEEATTFDQCSDMSWSTCKDIGPNVCMDHSTQTKIPHYISNFLSCRLDKQATYCDTEAECEASGRCHGPWLRDQICYMDEDVGTHTCKVVTNACKVGVDPSRQHMCLGSPDCDDEWGCWDDMRDHFGDYCIDYTIETESACGAASGEWLTITTTHQRDFCTSDTECQGGRSEWGNVWERDSTECRACGGTMRSWGQWSSGTWVTPEMVSGGREWKTRRMEQANTWSSRIDEWRIRDLVRTIEIQLNNEAQAAFARCMYGEIGDSVEKLASVCGGATPTQRDTVLAQDYPNFCNVSQYNGTAAKTGRKGSTNVEIGADSLDGIGQMCAVSMPTQPNSGMNPTSVRRRSLSRRLLSADEPSFDDASCWSLVRNSNDALVGQLLGDCVLVSLTAGLSTRNGVRLCLQTKPEREIDDAYNVDGFVERTEVDGAFKYTPVQKIVTREGEQLCASVTEMDTYFCPARLVDSWASATADVGSDECPIMVLMTDMQARAQARLLAQSDDELDDAIIPGIAIACFVFVVGVAVGVYVCVRRRKRLREEAAARKMYAKEHAVAVDTRQLTL